MRAGRRRGLTRRMAFCLPHLLLPPHRVCVRVLRAGAAQLLAVLTQRQVAVVQRDQGLAPAEGVGKVFGGLRGCVLGGEGERWEETEGDSAVPSWPPLTAFLGGHTSIITNSSGSKQPPDASSEIQAKFPQFPQGVGEEVDGGLLPPILGHSLSIPSVYHLAKQL